MRKWDSVFAGVSLVVLMMAPMAIAEPFLHPPETNWAVWVTDPYQRNILWDFSTDPQGGPSSGGAPGADYEGADDDGLKDSDYVTFSGAMTWYENGVEGSPTGVIGINNSEGTSPLTGSVLFHIDNWDDPNREKHVWFEFEVGFIGGVAWGEVLTAGGLHDPYTKNWGPYGEETLSWGGSWLARRGWYSAIIEPNPEWETLEITLSVDPGAVLVFDSYHIATECVPEPTTLGLFALTGLATAWRIRRRSR